MRSLIRSFESFGSVAFVLLAAACTDSSSSATTVLDPPRLSIDSIDSAGARRWTPGECLQAGTDPDKTIAINVGPNDGAGPSGIGGHLLSPGKTPVAWTLSPPFSCSGTPPCGFLVLTVYSCKSIDPSSCDKPPIAEVVAASTSIPWQTSGFSPGFFQFHVDLKNEDGSAAIDAAGKPHSADTVVEVREQCGPGEPVPPVGDGGRDAAAPPSPDGAVPEAGTGAPDAAIVTPEAGALPPDAAPPTAADATMPVDASPSPGAESGTPLPEAGPLPGDAAHD